MTGTLVSFVGMAIGGRELSLELDTFQILFFRSLIGLLILCLVLFNKGWHFAKTRHFPLHLLRNVSHFGGQFGWFYGIAYLPLSEVFAIEFTLPVWTAILATLILKEQMTLPRFFAVVFGILGMLVILRPGMGVLNPISLIVLASAVCFGLSHTLTRRIVWFDHPITILFYMTLIQLPFGFFLSINDWNSVSLSMWPWLIIVGITALTAHYCMARAFAIADATIVVPLDFLRLPLIAVIGYLFYNEMLDMFVLIGAFIMLFGNFINIRAEHIKEKSS
ncbi:MAG: DMT family transporter [Desulfobacula sp.]|jgi:drug/metabolite transporter (DMT)-like permease|nr:DMT family transporter [Desulfobacula sp.]